MGMHARDIMLVGTFGGGGVHQYIVNQQTELETRYGTDVSTYDVGTAPSGSGVVWFAYSFLLAAVAVVRFPFRTPPDVVHVHTSHRYSFYRSSFYVLFGAYVWRRPVVLHVHGSGFDEFIATDARPVRWLQSAVFDASDRVIALSDYWRQVLGSDVSAEKLAVVPNSVDPGAYTPEFTPEPPHVVYLSSLVERKGVADLMAALKIVDERVAGDYRVTIAGDGPLADQVERLAASHDHVEYAGYVSEERKRAILEAGSIFVLPSYAEGLPIAVLEGMAGGNAIVSTRVAGIPDVIDDRNGILVESGAPDRLADALVRLLESPDRVERMARRNRRLVEERYCWERTTDRLVEIYQAELDRPGDP